MIMRWETGRKTIWVKWDTI